MFQLSLYDIIDLKVFLYQIKNEKSYKKGIFEQIKKSLASG